MPHETTHIGPTADAATVGTAKIDVPTIRPNQATNVQTGRTAGHIAIGIPVENLACVESHKPSQVVSGACHIAFGIAIGLNGAGVLAHQAPDIARTTDAANVGVTIQDST